MKVDIRILIFNSLLRFGVAVHTIIRYFRNCINVMYCLFKNVIFGPDKTTLNSTMPACFREAFGEKNVVIIDCFEVFIENPSNLRSSAECWSSYEHYKTAKHLITIRPQGTICSISEDWGGRASDKCITENSDGFINRIEPGYGVLADRGFLIEETLHLLGVKLNIPAFTKGNVSYITINITIKYK